VSRVDLAAAASSPLAAEPQAAALAAGRRAGARRPLRLLHVFPSFNIGGAQVRLATLAAGFGPDVAHRILALAGNYEAADLLPAWVDVGYVSPPAAASWPGRLMAYGRILQAQQPDVLLTYNWGAIEFAMANRLLGYPHLHLEDGFGPEEAARQFRRRIWARRLALRRCHVLVPSSTLREVALGSWRLAPERLHHVPNGVCTAPPAAALAEILGPVRADGERRPVRIVWSGALRREKNPSRLLQAFGPLREKALLLIVGDGPERERVASEARALGLGEAVRLLGLRRDARAIINQCDILALSSDTEQMPLAVLEAMDAGLPVASVDVGDVRRMVSAENRPFVVGRTPQARGCALSALVDDAELRRRIGAANRVRAAEAYDARSMVRAHRELLEALAGRAG
jgi:glycosyltransferase involved in cell wall biosynthesis